MVEIDPATDTASQVGATIAGGSGINNVLFGGGCVGSNGKIYMAPYNADYFWEYDPRTTSGSSFGSFPGDSLFVGIVTSPQNNMYAIPYYSQNVVKFNCNNTGSTTTIPVTGGTFSYKWYGGALGTDGKIYGSPINATSSLVINTFNDTVSQIGSYAGGVEQYTGCVLAPNGKLVHIPYNVTSSLVIDTIGSGDTPVGGPLSDVVKSGYLNKF